MAWKIAWVVALAVITTRLAWKGILHAYLGEKTDPCCTMAGVHIPEGTPRSIEIHERVHWYTGAGFMRPLFFCYGWVPWVALGHGFWWTLLLWQITVSTSQILLESVADIVAGVRVGFSRYFQDVRDWEYSSLLKIISEKRNLMQSNPIMWWTAIFGFTMASTALNYPLWRLPLTLSALILARRKSRQDLS